MSHDILSHTHHHNSIAMQIAEWNNQFSVTPTPKHVMSKNDKVSDIDLRNDDVCSICLIDLRVGATKKLHCGHMFHTHCIRAQMHHLIEHNKQVKCPLCRAPYFG